MTDSVSSIAQGFPTIEAPLVNKDNTINQVWLQLLITLWNRTGMGPGVSASDAIAFAVLTENRLAIPLPNIDTDVAIVSALTAPLATSGGGASGLEGDLTTPAGFSRQDELASALFFPVPPSSGGITVKDEGTLITGAVTSIDFVGAGIAAVAAGSAVTVTVNGMLPLVNGDLPGPAFITDGFGQCIGVPL